MKMKFIFLRIKVIRSKLVKAQKIIQKQKEKILQEKFILKKVKFKTDII